MTARSSRAGFTFPELLNMLVLGAILAIIVYGLRHGRRGPAPDPAIAPMRSALMDLRDAEARYHGQTRQFTARLDSLNVAAAAGITREIDRADSVSWHATARKEGSSLLCELTVGMPGVVDTVVCRLAAP
jgi:Tfp pilus assembly protein PilE